MEESQLIQWYLSFNRWYTGTTIRHLYCHCLLHIYSSLCICSHHHHIPWYASDRRSPHRNAPDDANGPTYDAIWLVQ